MSTTHETPIVLSLAAGAACIWAIVAYQLVILASLL